MKKGTKQAQQKHLKARLKWKDKLCRRGWTYWTQYHKKLQQYARKCIVNFPSYTLNALVKETFWETIDLEMRKAICTEEWLSIEKKLQITNPDAPGIDVPPMWALPDSDNDE